MAAAYSTVAGAASSAAAGAAGAAGAGAAVVAAGAAVVAGAAVGEDVSLEPQEATIKLIATPNASLRIIPVRIYFPPYCFVQPVDPVKT